MKSIISGNLVDVFNKVIYPAEITLAGSRIKSIKKTNKQYSHFVLPGLIDAHIHIESTMLTPAGFAGMAVRHGTVGVVSDPHEISNVLGTEGVEFMIENGKSVPLKFFFGAPSCVPATEFESAGGCIDEIEVEKLIKRDDIFYLSEMMNFPGVLSGDKIVKQKIAHALKNHKPVDGHAPGLIGEELKKYIQAGISTDHECISLGEAEEKIANGMKIQIREGSAAKGFDMLCSLIDRYPDFTMLCSDDLHPDDLIEGHINKLLARGVEKGLDLYNLIRAATVNPVLHYRLPVGLLRENDNGDLIVVEDLVNFNVLKTYINGRIVYNRGEVLFDRALPEVINNFRTERVIPGDIIINSEGEYIRIIKVTDGELFTGSEVLKATVEKGIAHSDPGRDICKIVVVNRYENKKPAVAFINGFGLKKGALAGSVSHDSHNIIAIGINDEDIVNAINSVIEMRGGLAAVSTGSVMKMKLEIAGLMTSQEGSSVAVQYNRMEKFARELGSPLRSPFMSMSFMALLVIPELKIGDKGLFDVKTFSFTPLFVK